MATMQIANPLGLTMLVNFAVPESAFPLTRGISFLCCAAVFQTLALAVAGAVANSPALNLAAFILLSLVTSYLIYAVPTLGRLWIWIQVPVVTAFYTVLFLPTPLGWDNGEMFAGLAIATALLLLFNNLIWPERAEVTLVNSLTATLECLRLQLARVMAIAVGDLAADEDRPVASQLGHHLVLLGHAEHQAPRPGELGQLLSSIILAERIDHQIERIVSLVANALGALSNSQATGELREIAESIDERFEHLIHQLHQQVLDPAKREEVAPPHLPAADLSNRLARISSDSTELARLAAVLAVLANLLEVDSFEPPADFGDLRELAPASMHGSNHFLVRFAVRHTIAMTIAFLIGLWDNTPALHAAIWLLMIGGPPSHGATVRKFTIRALGCAGALALATLGTILVAPNYTSLLPYMAVIFMSTSLMAYLAEGGGILSYLAVGGTAFVAAYSAPGPRDMAEPIWNIWGHSVGMIIRALVALVWPEHVYRTLAEEFQAPLACILELTRNISSPSDRSRGSMAAIMAFKSIQLMLGVANDAQLEGSSAGIDPANLLDALDTLIKLVFVLANAGHLMAAEEPAISPSVLNALRSRLETWLEKLSAETESGAISPAPLRRMVNEAIVPPLDAISASEEATALLAPIQMELDRDIINLTRTLEQQLTAISLE
jgi:hypothetical protein